MSTLRGSLKSISLMDVIQLLHVNKKTGKLYVNAEKSNGILFVVGGEVNHAETSQLTGESAAFEILEWDEGEFEFVAGLVKAPVTIKRAVPDLLMESARTSDSRKRLRTFFPNLRATPWPTLSDPALTAGLRVFQEDRKVYHFLDGYRNFLEIMSASLQSEVTVLQACHTLREAGRLEVFEPEVTLTVTTAKSSFFKRATRIEVPRSMEVFWRAMGAYAQAPLERLRVSWPEGPGVDQAIFVDGLPEGQVAIPKELMQSWRLSEGMPVTLRPEP